MTSIRPTGIDHAAAALRNLERRQEVIANNLANVSTTGFKGERVFSQLLEAEQTTSIGTSTDLRGGALNATGRALDVAIDREGFFVVGTPEGERWTRGGSLDIDAQRQLTDATGSVMLGESGPITIPDSVRDLQINSAGAVIADGKEIARLRVERPTGAGSLEHLGDGHLRPAEKHESVDGANRTVRQGSLEESNVSSMESMVDLISVQRAYASVQKVLTTIDSVRNLAATQIGKPS